jgi:hypothetical protein
VIIACSGMAMLSAIARQWQVVMIDVASGWQRGG